MTKASVQEKCPLGKEDHKHQFAPNQDLRSILNWQPEQRQGALYEAYKKHSAELRAIEDSDSKYLLLMLTVF